MYRKIFENPGDQYIQFDIKINKKITSGSLTNPKETTYLKNLKLYDISPRVLFWDNPIIVKVSNIFFVFCLLDLTNI